MDWIVGLDSIGFDWVMKMMEVMIMTMMGVLTALATQQLAFDDEDDYDASSYSTSDTELGFDAEKFTKHGIQHSERYRMVQEGVKKK